MDRELAEIRKEIVEARNLVIKNDNLLKNLGSDLKALGKKQEAFERRQWIASAAAYLGFAAIAAAAAVVGARGYVSSARQDAEIQAAAAARSAAEAEKIRAELAAHQKAAEAAYAAYARLDEGDGAAREKAALALRELDRGKLSRLESRALDDRSRSIVREIAGEAYEAGSGAFRRQDYRTTVAELSKAVELWPDHPDANELSFFLGAAAVQTRDHALAVTALQRFLEKGRSKTNKDYAHLLLGQALEATGEKDRAIAIWTKGSNDFPVRESAPIMRRRISALRKAAQEAAAAAPAATAADGR